MSKKIVILSGSPRKGGNSDILCNGFCYITTMADEEKASADTTLACFRGYADCVEGAMEKGTLVASGVYEPGAVRSTPAMAQAYEMGRNVSWQ